MIRNVTNVFNYFESIRLSHLTNNLHGEFTNDVLTKAKATPTIVENLPKQLAAFEAAVEAETRASFKDLSDSLTEKINNELVPARDKVETGLKSGFRAMMEMPNPEVAAAAAALFELAHLHRLHTDMKVDAQTDAIRDFIADVKANHQAELELTGMQELFAKLEAANEAVCDAMAERTEADSERVTGVMEAARQQTDDAYRELMHGVDAFAYVQGTDGYAGFINYANALIARYKRVYLNQTVGGTEAGGEETEDTDTPEETPSTPEETPGTPDTPNTPDTPAEGQTKYTVDWVNKDGDTVKTMQVEAGTKLTSSDYPKAANGYIWKPSWIGGGLTVNGNITIREELDDDLGV